MRRPGDAEPVEVEDLKAALLESHALNRLLFVASPVALLVFDVETLEPIVVNDAALSLYGYQREEFLPLKVAALAGETEAAMKARLALTPDTELNGTARHLRKDGSFLIAEYTSRPVTFNGRRARITSLIDVTGRHEGERTRALLAAIVESSNDAIVSTLLDGTIASWNGAAERLFGYTALEAVGQPIGLIVPGDRQQEEAELLGRISGGERIELFETERQRKDGARVAVSISLAPVSDATGKVVGISKTLRDLTAQNAAAAVLRETEGQLRQSQKMEAVGRLAGGIAHDFNNLLSVILSYSDLLLSDRRLGAQSSADLNEIRRAAMSASDLTTRLLAFSRKQVIDPKVLDLNEMLAGMDRILARVLGEDVELVSSLAPGLGRIRVDASNLEQVLMNLAVNARDAMPSGGKLTLETGNVELDAEYAAHHLGVEPGAYVMLAVSDSGVGMDAATQARIFEPFFTTKEVGKGTGLGLSTVFGIVQQARGSVWVYSEPGKGTTFKLYFPRADVEAEAAGPAPAVTSLRGAETILLVEDQEQVRGAAHAILKQCGYRVLVAASPPEALSLCEAHSGPIHLILTDVVMPQMSGTALVQEVRALRPTIKVLYMSGYTDDSVVRHGILESELAFLQKPFTPESLSRKLRAVLDA